MTRAVQGLAFSGTCLEKLVDNKVIEECWPWGERISLMEKIIKNIVLGKSKEFHIL